MNEHGTRQRAGLWRRAAARAIDALVMAVLALLIFTVASVVSWVIARPGFWTDENVGEFWIVFLLVLVVGSIPVTRYEVAATARRGQTFGKRCTGIRVDPWNDEAASVNDGPYLPGRACFVRWAIPHGACLFAVVGATMVMLPSPRPLDIVGAGLWTLLFVYLSSVLDENGRGWHDKAAGKIVVMARDAHMEQ